MPRSGEPGVCNFILDTHKDMCEHGIVHHYSLATALKNIQRGVRGEDSVKKEVYDSASHAAQAERIALAGYFIPEVWGQFHGILDQELPAILSGVDLSQRYLQSERYQAVRVELDKKVEECVGRWYTQCLQNMSEEDVSPRDKAFTRYIQIIYPTAFETIDNHIVAGLETAMHTTLNALYLVHVVGERQYKNDPHLPHIIRAAARDAKGIVVALAKVDLSLLAAFNQVTGFEDGGNFMSTIKSDLFTIREELQDGETYYCIQLTDSAYQGIATNYRKIVTTEALANDVPAASFGCPFMLTPATTTGGAIHEMFDDVYRIVDTHLFPPATA